MVEYGPDCKLVILTKCIIEDSLHSWKWPFDHLTAGQHPCPQQQQEDAGLAPGGAVEGYWDPWLQPFGRFYVGQFKASQQNQEPDPKDQGGDGLPRQEHRGEGLQEVQVQEERLSSLTVAPEGS
jgi:hypothetical protein